MSPLEAKLWAVLRARPSGFKFRRQHPAKPYTLDFFCHSAALIIEVDGASHEMGDNPARDEQRDHWLAARGLKTFRFTAADVLNNLEAVVRQIEQECASRSPPPRSARSPSPNRGED